MLGGYAGRIFNIDLSAGKAGEERLSEDLLHDMVGGAGLGARLILNRQKKGVDALDPANVFAVATGPFVGAGVPGATRYQAMGRSPLTGAWGDASAGGTFALGMKKAGCDAIFVEGASDRPLYLLIDRSKAELRSAVHIWGKDTFATEDILRNELGQDTSILCIGPAGEKLSLIAAVMNDKGRAAARSGLAAVLGSKKLKAIAVRGDAPITVLQPDKMKEVRSSLARKSLDPRRNPLLRMYHKFGNCGLMRYYCKGGGSPYKNWSGTRHEDFPDVDEKLGAHRIIAYQEQREPCPGCPVGCGGRLKAGGGEFAWEAGALKPEFESLAFGAKCLVREVEAVIKSCDICNRYGLDHSSVAAVIGFAMECFEKGLITQKDTDGLDLTWGNARAMVQMTEAIGERRGLGGLLADGVKRASAKIPGSEPYAIHVFGQEIDISDPRDANGLAWVYVADATPGRHTPGSTFYAETAVPPDGLGVPKSWAHDYKGKGEDSRRMNGFHNVMNALGLCLFMPYTGYLDVESMQECFKYVCGWDYPLSDILDTGDRIAAARMAFNLREGINPIRDFKLPERVRPPVLTGPGWDWRATDLSTMTRDYLTVMQWDTVTCMPSRRRLEQLRMTDVADALGV